MDHKILVDSDLIFLDCSAADRNEAIDLIGSRMMSKGFVKNSFIDAVLEREEQYPTGLEIGEINIAIPHTEPEHVNKPCIGIAVLNDPVVFQRMDDVESQVNVKVIFLIALKNGHEHMEFLKNVMTACRDKSFLADLMTNNNVDEIQEKLQNKILM